MKRIIYLLFFVLTSVMVYAQRDVTKFLGIPVDGFKADMIKKLQAKGYVYDQKLDMLRGEFNGNQVLIKVVTNNNKVWRIYLADENSVGETAIKIRFNKLCRQFENNKKYEKMLWGNYEIDDEEDLSYEISVNDKRYEAAYYQKLNDADSILHQQYITERLKQIYTDEQLNDTSQSIISDIKWDRIKYRRELKEKKRYGS